LDRLEKLVDRLSDADIAVQIQALMADFDYDRIVVLLGGDPSAS